MKLKIQILAVAAIMAALIVAPAFAAANGQSEKEQYVGTEFDAHWHDIDTDFMATFHNPTDWLSMGLNLRYRYVYGENYGLDKDSATDRFNYQRIRTRWSTKSQLTEDIDFNTRLVWEFFIWDKPSAKPQSTDFDEAIFDHFNITVRNAFDMPLTVVVGRQDIILGTGWLVLEGTPADGSRTIYFDAVRATYDMAENDSVLDLVYIQQYDGETKWLSPINHRPTRHVTYGSDEVGLIAYLTNKSLEDTKLEGYFIYKNDKESNYSKFSDSLTDGTDAEIYTFGGAIDGKIGDNMKYRAEIAKQIGDKDGADLNALGFNSRMTYAFHDELSSAFNLDYEFLSGDDESTSKDECFDPLWGRYPQKNRGGDLPIYVFAGESGKLGEMSNLHRVGFSYDFKPAKDWTISAMYNLYWADENITTDPGDRYDDNDSFRGQMLTTYFKYKCCKKLSAHFLIDYFMPGSFYDSGTQDEALFTRFNLEYTF